MRKSVALMGAAVAACCILTPAFANDGGEAKEIRQASVDASVMNKAGVATNAPAKTKKKAAKRRGARLVARINLSSQRMNVVVDGAVVHSWNISSGARGYHTPTGTYRPYHMTRMHYSRKYNNAPMPHSVFFRGGYAIHATGAISRLGTPASHGCIRLHPGNARTFYNLVRKYGKSGTRVAISGSTPAYKPRRKKRVASNTSFTYTSQPRRRRSSASWSQVTNYGNNYVSYRKYRKGRRASNGRILNSSWW
jgi:lipoprotein-anchoring transpeptidase ErfK/SrfK